MDMGKTRDDGYRKCLERQFGDDCSLHKDLQSADTTVLITKTLTSHRVRREKSQLLVQTMEGFGHASRL